MEATKRREKNLLQRLFHWPPGLRPPSAPRAPLSSPLDPETGRVQQQHHHRQQPQSVPAIGVAPHYAQPNLDWPVSVIGFCFSSAVAIAVQSLPTGARLPITFQLLCLAMACAVAALFVAKYIASKLPDQARVLEHVGVFFGVTAFFLTITIPSPLWLKLTFWSVYALSVLAIVVCNSSVFFTYLRENRILPKEF